MDKKREAMLTGLDESQRSYMDLRFQGITGQASSQIAVSQQAAKNDANLISYDRQMNGIANDGVRYSPLYSGPAAQPAAAPGMIRSVTQGLPPSVQAGISYDRTPERNKEVGGAPDSQHLRPGSAADISTKGMPEAERQQLITSLMSNPNVRGLGFYDGHIHVDTDRTSRVTWGTPPAALKDTVEQWKVQPAPGGGMSSTDVAATLPACDVAAQQRSQRGGDPRPHDRRQRHRRSGRRAAGQARAAARRHGAEDGDRRQGQSDQGPDLQARRQRHHRPGADRPGARQDPRLRRDLAAFKEQIEQSLMQALDYKIGQSNAMAQSHQLASSRVADGRIRDYNIRATQAELNPDPIAQAEAKRQLKQESSTSCRTATSRTARRCASPAPPPRRPAWPVPR